MKKFYLQLYHHTFSVKDEDTWVEVSSLGMHPDMAELLARQGIIDIHLGHIPARQAGRVQKLLRLRRDLGVNLPGAAVILNLLERIERLEEDLDRLKRR